MRLSSCKQRSFVKEVEDYETGNLYHFIFIGGVKKSHRHGVFFEKTHHYEIYLAYPSLDYHDIMVKIGVIDLESAKNRSDEELKELLFKKALPFLDEGIRKLENVMRTLFMEPEESDVEEDDDLDVVSDYRIKIDKIELLQMVNNHAAELIQMGEIDQIIDFIGEGKTIQDFGRTSNMLVV